MTSGQKVPDSFSTTPPDQPIKLPPTPPDTGKRSDIASVEELRWFWSTRTSKVASALDETREIRLSRDFDPHKHEDAINNFLPRFDCYAKRSSRKIVVRMPSRIHEGFIAYIEEECYNQLKKNSSQRPKIEIGRSSRVLLYDGTQSRQPDTQFLDSEDVPRVIVEVAYTQSGKYGFKIAEDYIFGTNGKVKRVFVCDLNPLGQSSTISEWEGRITETADPKYDGDLSVVLIKSKEFRTADGAPKNDDDSLSLPYCDFDAGSNNRNVISISFRNLYEALRKLEIKRPRPEESVNLGPGSKRLRFRLRSSTPAEELRPADERKFQEAEAAAVNDESDFQPSTDESDLDSSIQASTVAQ